MTRRTRVRYLVVGVRGDGFLEDPFAIGPYHSYRRADKRKGQVEKANEAIVADVIPLTSDAEAPALLREMREQRAHDLEGLD